ncbi:hypothetical protein [Candidatus Nitrososphaera sp. FF02]|uniref:hypothetical protein n=1 Tax=Candidatus Nitrososphaera sp. FF02 TaxID=3398226 RepID=UPI0039EA5E11
MSSADTVRAAFREYYFKQSKMIEAPDEVEKREFGYAQFGARGMVRHLSFKNMGELVATLITQVPSDVYCSNALYRFPTLPMQEKQWLGADLIFDIDGKDLNLPCVPSHSYPVCSNCRPGLAAVREGIRLPFVRQQKGRTHVDTMRQMRRRLEKGGKALDRVHGRRPRHTKREHPRVFFRQQRVPLPRQRRLVQAP